jgi:hypothetical protein
MTLHIGKQQHRRGREDPRTVDLGHWSRGRGSRGKSSVRGRRLLGLGPYTPRSAGCPARPCQAVAGPAYRSADLELRNRLGRARSTGSSGPAGRAPSDDAGPGARGRLAEGRRLAMCPDRARRTHCRPRDRSPRSWPHGHSPSSPRHVPVVRRRLRDVPVGSCLTSSPLRWERSRA